MWTRFVSTLASPISGRSLAIFRVFFGLVLTLQAYEFLVGYQGSDWVTLTIGENGEQWTFPFPGFTWVRPLPEPWTTALLYILGVCGICLALGLAYRISATASFLVWTYIFLIEQSSYNNHYYLMSMIAFLLIWMPADRWYSLDRVLDEGKSSLPTPIRFSIPFWPVFLLRAQLFLVYFYGGITKLNADWLVEAAPLKYWLRQNNVLQPIRPFVSKDVLEQLNQFVQSDAVAYFLAYTGTIYDLAIGFLLIFRRTRILGFTLTVIFHFMNHVLLFDDIGVFPYLGVAATTIFLEPDWPRRVRLWFRRRDIPRPDWGWFIAGGLFLPVVGATLGWSVRPTRRAVPLPPKQISSIVPLFVATWLVLQILIPLRHFCYAGDVNWTAEGELFSWRMKGNVKVLRELAIDVVDPGLGAPVSEGGQRIDWNNVQGIPKAYRDVDPKAIDWRQLPEIVLIHQPLWGERIIFNPFAGRENLPLSIEESKAKAEQIWQQRFSRTPEMQPTVDPASVVDEYLEKISGENPKSSLLPRLRRIKENVALLAKPDLTTRAQRQAVTRLQSDLGIIYQDLKHGGDFRLAMARVHPFAFDGAPSPSSPFLAIEDKELELLDVANYRAVDRKKWRKNPREVESVLIALKNANQIDLVVLPLWLYIEQKEGEYQIRWNYSRDLTRPKILAMARRPTMCRLYADRISSAWRTEFGRAPKVNFRMLVAIYGHEPSLAVDPTADLATAPITYFGHNDWVLFPDSAPKQVPAKEEGSPHRASEE
ncbi:MAG: HTTM domain-containing protein [Planctomycetota bacterium]